MRVVSIMQPAYLPWCGYIQRILMSDVHVVLDHVKMDAHTKTQFTNRNRILTANGTEWLTIPYLKRSSRGLIINELRIDNSQKWQRKHWDKIRAAYGQAPFFHEHEPFFSDFYTRPFEFLVDAIEASTAYFLDVFQCRVSRVKSSGMKGLRAKSELILDICRAAGADSYLAGPFSRDYLSLGIFEEANIMVTYHDYAPVPYPQQHEGFTPYLSVLDLLFNVGAEQAGNILAPPVPGAVA